MNSGVPIENAAGGVGGGVPIENAAGGVGADHECPDPVHLQLQQGRDLKYILKSIYSYSQ